MDNEYPKDQESSATDSEHPDAAMSRRRFTRAGAAGTVVLGALASKPVLGAAPYQCTVSGQVSGNLSHTTSDSCRIGYSPSFWRGVDWPSTLVNPIIKGTLPNDSNCKFEGNTGGPSGVPRVRGTNFNGYSGLENAFYNNNPAAGGSCTVVTSNASGDPATMLQVLWTTEVGYGDLHLGRVVVASLLNVAQFPATYPVTTQRIIAMFNATFPSGDYMVNGTIPWSRAQVITYLESLFQ